MSSNLVPWMIISWIHDGYYGNMVDEYHIIYTYLVPCWCYTEPESRDSYHGHMIPWHHVSLRRQGWAVCVCATQLAAHVSVSSTLQGHNLMSHDHIFGSESHTNVRNHESVGDLLLVYLHFWSWTQVSVYRDWVKLPRSYFSISLYKVYQDKISTNSETMSSLK